MSGDLPATRPRAVVHPLTGEVLELEAAATDELAAVIDEFDRRERTTKQWRELAEAELLKRLHEHRRRRLVVGDWEIAITSSGRGRVWDTDELEATCREFVDDGTLHAGELTGLLTPQPAKVDGKLAAALITRVTDSAREALERCFHWETKGRERLAVTRSVELAPANDTQKRLTGAEPAQETTE